MAAAASATTRRAVTRGIAWSAPVLVVAAGAPVMRASPVPDLLPIIEPGAQSYSTSAYITTTYYVANFGSADTDGTSPIQLYIAKPTVPYSDPVGQRDRRDQL